MNQGGRPEGALSARADRLCLFFESVEWDSIEGVYFWVHDEQPDPEKWDGQEGSFFISPPTSQASQPSAILPSL